MFLRDLRLFNFKNYESLSVDFSADINCITGLNGAGKTGLLDAVYVLSTTKSAFTSDSRSIRHGEAAFSVAGTFHCNEHEDLVVCAYREGERKTVKLNGNFYEKITDHPGKYPVIMMSPDDTDVVREGSDLRRKVFDAALAQIDKEYLEWILLYGKVLRQRNSLLKNFGGRSFGADRALFESYDELIIGLSEKIFRRRTAFLETIYPFFSEKYEYLTERAEEARIEYDSPLADPEFRRAYEDSFEKDLFLQRTSLGVHRDDFVFKIDGHLLRKYGSQGQRKSLVIALKLAFFHALKEAKGMKPILLLDDIFDKLDDVRMAKLTEMISNGEFGQVFITDARPERTEQLVSRLSGDVRVRRVENGTIR